MHFFNEYVLLNYPQMQLDNCIMTTSIETLASFTNNLQHTI